MKFFLNFILTEVVEESAYEYEVFGQLAVLAPQKFDTEKF